MDRAVSLAAGVCVLSALAFGQTTYFPSSLDVNDPPDSLAAEAAYLGDLAAMGYQVLHEGFEGAAWDSVRSDAAQNPPVSRTAASIVSGGITWSTSDGNAITTSDTLWGPVHDYHLFTKYSAPGGLHAVPDTIIGVSPVTLYGIGVWVSGGPPGKGKLSILLDDGPPITFERIIGWDFDQDVPEPIKDDVRLTSGKEFFGVIDPAGFTKFQLLETEGRIGDQALMWSDEYRLGLIPPPGDADLDLDVDAADYLAVKAHLGTTEGASWAEGDFDGDGDVDGDDLRLLEAGFIAPGFAQPAAAVPEPAALALLAAGVPLLAWRRRAARASRLTR